MVKPFDMRQSVLCFHSFAVLNDMIQRCPHNAVTALLLHQLKEEMIQSWPAHEASSTGTSASETGLALCDKGPFVTFGASLVMDAVPSFPSHIWLCKRSGTVRVRDR
jgi:hypothetical protein